MTRQKKEEQYTQIKSLIFLLIRKQGYFNYWLDGDDLFFDIAELMNCSIHLVRKIFFKDIYVHYKNFIENFEY